MLINIVKRQELMLVNSSERTSGKWTREEGNAKSIIDYVLIKQEDEDDVTEMKIDEEKHLAPMRIVKVDGECKAVYSRIQGGFKSIYLQQPIHYPTLLINKL